VDHDLRLSRVGRRAGLARTVAQTFLGHAPGLLDPIDAAVSAGDAEELYRGAHGLRAALLMVGAVPASELAAQLEQAIPGEAAALRGQLAAEIARVSAELTLIVGE
jgi:HPt (histidine-containing phosphotransfer) domain-containing protein